MTTKRPSPDNNDKVDAARTVSKDQHGGGGPHQTTTMWQGATTMGVRPLQGKRLVDDDDDDMWDGRRGLHRTNSPQTMTTTATMWGGTTRPPPPDNDEDEVSTGQMAHRQ